MTVGPRRVDGLNPGDEVGNRRKFNEVRIPLDNVGNRKELVEWQMIPLDNLGNSIDEAPTHQMSGILNELSGKGKKRRYETAPSLRIGRYLEGGVNPLVTGADQGNQSTEESWTEDDRNRRGRRRGKDRPEFRRDREPSRGARPEFNLFSFDDDERADFVLKSDPEDKRKAAELTVQTILGHADRKAIATATLETDTEGKPRVTVWINDEGAAASVPAERRSLESDKPLFVSGDIALSALNFIVNKIVNRYPDDRIRLQVLPKTE